MSRIYYSAEVHGSIQRQSHDPLQECYSDGMSVIVYGMFIEGLS